MTRLIIVGSRSFIAGHVRDAAVARGIEVVCFTRDEPFADALREGDAAVNFALHTDYRTGPYEQSQDCDLRVATACRDAGAFFVMLSTRRVYPATVCWAAHEVSDAGGDETRYGQNKATTEKAVLQVLDRDAAILRLSNIFGFEYDPSGDRRTFFGQALKSLRQDGQIVLDMHPDTRRDFLPVEHCARAIVDRVQKRGGGIYNVGAGFPVACGNIAHWVLEGYGSGKLTVSNSEIRDEFYLDTGKWQAQFGALLDMDELRNRCIALGRMLK